MPQSMTNYDPTTLVMFVDTLATTVDLLNPPADDGTGDGQPALDPSA